MTFYEWMRAVDAHLMRNVGVTSGDLPDACLHDWFLDGIEPQEAAQLLVEEAMF